ncbi:MAG: peptide chain release factor N(5)-glutamine methyltransferase [Planctomycetota bacterium]|jgi:release factor glutamine methyltransferase|nr:peptide chain release factor N(5)-glutamine methyltransferase [Planctomycetota bacterium]
MDKIWKPLELVKVTAGYLAEKRIPNPRLDAELLLLEILGLKRRVDLYAGFEREISGKELASFRELIRRRAAREPVSRILARREFMGITFRVTPDVLSPRPETELLVEAAIEAASPARPPAEKTPGEDWYGDQAALPDELVSLLDAYAGDIDDAEALDPDLPAGPSPAAGPPLGPATAKKKAGKRLSAKPGLRLLDLGTGGGCIAVALAASLPGAMVVAIDASAKALAVAKRNAAEAGVAKRIDFRRGDWFGGCRKGEVFDAILANPPYLVEGDPDIWPEVSRHDPPAALYAGRDGLDCYRRIIPDSPNWLAADGRIFFEVGAGQAAAVGRLLENAGYRAVSTIRDYGGTERVVTGTAPAAL